MASLISIGVTGLTASQTALTTTGNNITNANTPGYSRQRANLVTLPEQATGAGFMGSGVQVQSITRIVEQFTIGQLRTNTSIYHAANSMATQFEQLDSLLADSSTGIAPSLQNFFNAIQQASQDPTSVATRQVVLGAAGSLAQRFNTLSDQVAAQTVAINDQVASLTGQITSLSQSIAKLNQNIADQIGSSSGAMPNELLDKRDEMLRQMSEMVDVRVVQNGNMVNVFVGSGQPLVVGNQSNTLSTAPSSTDPSRQQIMFSSGGNTNQDITALVAGGKLGGLVQYRDSGLANVANTLGRIALTIADTMNQQQQLGLDLNSQFGNNLFADINGSLAMTGRVSSAGTNALPADRLLGVRITDTSALTTSDYQLNFTSATGYSLARISDGTAVASGAIGALPATITTPDGFQIELTSGSYQAGDRFIIRPTATAARDMAVSLQKPEELAFAQPISTGASLGNAGGGAISAGITLDTRLASGALQSTFATPGTLTPPLLVRFNTPANTYDILNNTNPAAPVAIAGMSGLAFTPGQNNLVTINDPVSLQPVYSFSLSGNPAAGDSFTVGFNQNGSSDNRNAKGLADLGTARVVGGSVTFADSYGQLVSDVGSRTAELKINREAADTLMIQAQAERDSISGVNLDEEAANLIKFEQAYNASAQVISVARSIFDTLLAAFR
ncbi:MAG: flagellar hook-associated protein FlgK [Spongiibacteraceae bacterium]